jgi:hypothetical protein
MKEINILSIIKYNIETLCKWCEDILHDKDMHYTLQKKIPKNMEYVRESWRPIR